MDDLKEVCNKAHADTCADVEMEGLASGQLGHVFYLGLKNSEKAKKYYGDCLRLLGTLQSKKTFNGEKWHQDVMKHSNEIT